MAPKTRARKSGPSTAQQSTLSFNSKASKVTKASTTVLSDKKPNSKLNEIAPEEVSGQISEAEEQPVAEVQLDPQAQDPTVAADEVAETTPKPKSKKKSRISTGSTASTKEEIESLEAATTLAEKVSDGEIKKYWKAEEDARIAPRVHQQDLSMHEKILRHFDLSSQYGPCIGIPRLQRWKRAFTLSLNPPIEVLAVLLKEEQKGADRGDKVKGSKETRQCGRLAYVDELGGGRVVLVE